MELAFIGVNVNQLFLKNLMKKIFLMQSFAISLPKKKEKKVGFQTYLVAYIYFLLGKLP